MSQDARRPVRAATVKARNFLAIHDVHVELGAKPRAVLAGVTGIGNHSGAANPKAASKTILRFRLSARPKPASLRTRTIAPGNGIFAAETDGRMRPCKAQSVAVQSPQTAPSRLNLRECRAMLPSGKPGPLGRTSWWWGESDRSILPECARLAISEACGLIYWRDTVKKIRAALAVMTAADRPTKRPR